MLCLATLLVQVPAEAHKAFHGQKCVALATAESAEHAPSSTVLTTCVIPHFSLDHPVSFATNVLHCTRCKHERNVEASLQAVVVFHTTVSKCHGNTTHMHFSSQRECAASVVVDAILFTSAYVVVSLMF